MTKHTFGDISVIIDPPKHVLVTHEGYQTMAFSNQDIDDFANALAAAREELKPKAVRKDLDCGTMLCVYPAGHGYITSLDPGVKALELSITAVYNLKTALNDIARI